MQIQVSALHKSFIDGEGHTLHILQGLDFELRKGSTAAIVGASGTGKSTFLHLLGTLEQADSGKIRFEGLDLTRLKREESSAFRNHEIGFIFQFHQLLQDFTALENVMLPCLIQGLSESHARAHARELLHRVGLGERLSHKPPQLSGGEQQRVAMARALSNSPRLLLADEPTGNLDKETGEHVMDVLLRLNRENGATLIMITHNLQLAKSMEKQFRMENGLLHPLAPMQANGPDPHRQTKEVPAHLQTQVPGVIS